MCTLYSPLPSPPPPPTHTHLWQPLPHKETHLLGGGLQLPGHNGADALNGACGGKSPAGTALLLVLDLRMCVFAVCAGV